MARVVVIALLMALIVGIVLAVGQPASDDDALRVSSNATTTTTIQMAAPVIGPPRAVSLTSSAGNGRTRIERSLPCDGSEGDAGYWHLMGEQPLAAGVLTAPGSSVPGDLRLFADLHSPSHTIRATPEPVASPGPLANSAYLQPGASRVSLSNARGTVQLGLAAGACEGPMPFAFNGTQASGPGTWQVTSTSGSYRNATGTGSFTLDAGVSPGADNPWALRMTGNLAVLQPQLDVRLADVYWGRDGVDYALRQVAAVYQVTNIGAGDSYGAQLTAASSPTFGAGLVRITVNGRQLFVDGNTPVGGGFPRSLGDLASGEQILVTVVWQLPAPATNPPCKAVILGCQIETALSFNTPDALDLPVTTNVAIPVKAPNTPPPT